MAAAGGYVAGGNGSCRVATLEGEGAASDGGEGWGFSSSHAVAEGSQRLLLFPLAAAPVSDMSGSCSRSPLVNLLRRRATVASADSTHGWRRWPNRPP